MGRGTSALVASGKYFRTFLVPAEQATANHYLNPVSVHSPSLPWTLVEFGSRASYSVTSGTSNAEQQNQWMNAYGIVVRYWVAYPLPVSYLCFASSVSHSSTDKNLVRVFFSTSRNEFEGNNEMRRWHFPTVRNEYEFICLSLLNGVGSQIKCSAFDIIGRLIEQYCICK